MLLVAMLGNLPLYFLRLYRSIWFLPSAYALGSVAVLISAPAFGAWMPEGADRYLRADTLEKILSILASSMLAVAIFSLGTMVSALDAASSAATPRARVLLTEDRMAQVAISTFIGAFIFGVLGIIGVSTGSYNAQSVAFIFAFALLIIAVVIVVMISWIHRLSQIGGVESVIQMVEHTTSRIFAKVVDEQLYGGRSYVTAPANLEPVFVNSFGYLQHIDGESLGAFAEDEHIDLYLVTRPGELVGTRQPVLLASQGLSKVQVKRLREFFVFGEQRTFEEDPRFGLLVLSEIASRGLSPAVNDPGTAIRVLGAMVRVIRHWRQAVAAKKGAVRFPHLYVPLISIGEVIEDGFRWIARDGSRHLEVAIHIQKALAEVRSLDAVTFGPAVASMSEEALERARSTMTDGDFAMLLEHSKALDVLGDTRAA